MFKKIIYLIQNLSDRYNRHHITAYSAQMAYFFMLSIFPLLIFIFMIGDKLNVLTALQNNELFFAIPLEFREFLVDFTDQIQSNGSIAILSFSGLGALYAASRAITALQRAMNAVYEINESRPFIYLKILGMFYTLLFTIVMILTLLLPSFALKFYEMIPEYMAHFFALNMIDWWSMMRYGVIAGINVLLFGSIYTILPNQKMHFKEVYYGAIFAFIASMAENIIFSNVVTKLTNYTMLYGSLSVVIVFMLWLYILGIIIMLGAEINAIIWVNKKDKAEMQDEESEVHLMK